jgi:hypothetical protein
LEVNEDVEDISHVVTSSINIILERVERSVVPVLFSPRVKEVIGGSSFESPGWVRFREEVFTPEYNGIDDDDLVDGHAQNVFDHFTGNDVLISPIRRSG